MFLKMLSVKISINSKGNSQERVPLEKCSFAGMEGLPSRKEEALTDVFPGSFPISFMEPFSRKFVRG